MHIIVKIIVIYIFFSSFNDIDLLGSMLADCCMPWHQEWGLVGISAWNSAESRNYSDSGPFELQNFHPNFIFQIIIFFPANS